MNCNKYKTVLLIEGLDEQLPVLNEYKLECHLSKPPISVRTWSDVELVVKSTPTIDRFLREAIYSKQAPMEFYLYIDEEKGKPKTRERLIAELFKPFDNILHDLITDTKITLNGTLEQYTTDISDEDTTSTSTLTIRVYNAIL